MSQSHLYTYPIISTSNPYPSMKHISEPDTQKCKLQMNPASLPFTRALRSSHDVSITFHPTSTSQTVTHRRAHVFILSDLFLVAEWMEASDKAAKAQAVMRDQPERVGQGGPMPEMWLCYPPLAGRHLVVAEGQQGEFPQMLLKCC